jgi:hypothetical protein
MPGSFSGNGSVRWIIDQRKKLGPSFLLEGTEPTPVSGFFKVTIKHPRDQAEKRRFLERLRAELDRTDTQSVVLFLPIEDTRKGRRATEKQIHVDWPFKTPPQSASKRRR